MKMMGMTASLTAATRLGDKTQTRRSIVKFFDNQKKKCSPPDDSYVYMGIQGFEKPCALWYSEKHNNSIWAKLPYQRGDIVAIREPAVIESYSIDADGKCTIKYLYKADEDYERRTPEAMELPERFFDEVSGAPDNWVYRHMGGVPNGCIIEMLRTFVRIVDVRVEKLNAISNEDAKAEGLERLTDPVLTGQVFYPRYGLKEQFPYFHENEAAKSFGSLWESIEGKGSFDDRYVFIFEYAFLTKAEVAAWTRS